MKKLFLITLSLFWFLANQFAQDAQYVWAKGIGSTNYDLGQSVAVDAAGNVYSTGYFMETVDFDPGVGVFNLTSSGYQEVFILKLDASGNFVWAKKMGGTNYDLGQSIALDASGNIYTTGYFRGTADYDPGTGVFNLVSAGSNDVFISKLDASGNFVWAKRLGSTGSDIGYSIFTGMDGGIYIGGAFYGTVDFDPGSGAYPMTSFGGTDSFILKLDADGNLLWARQTGGGGEDYIDFVLQDNAGNIYSTGWFSGTCDFDPGAGIFSLSSAGSNDIFISKLDASGNFAWAKSFGSTNEDAGYSLCVNGSGQVMATGFFDGTVDFDPGSAVYNLTSAGNYDVFVLKLDASGNLVWAKNMGGTSADKGYYLTDDPSGNVVITGQFSLTADFDPGSGSFNLTSAGMTDVFVAKLNPSGNFVWAKKMGGTSDDYVYSLTLDPQKNILSIGRFAATADFDPGAATANITSKGLYDIFISKLKQTEPLAANFTASDTIVLVGNSVQFTDLSTGNPTNWEWDFNNDGIVDSYQQNPSWTYDVPGVYSVSLKVITPATSNTLVKTDYILVNSNSVLPSVTNVTASQRTDGSKMVDVYYNLAGNATAYFVMLEVSFDNGQSYQLVNQVSGHTGNVSPAQNLHLVWNAGAEFSYGFYNPNMKVKIVANETYVPQCGDYITDLDGNLYSTVQIGSQCWMAQNLNVGTRVEGYLNQTQNGATEKYCYNDLPANCNVYGGLYQWDEMMNYSLTPGSQGICMSGWHIPTTDEWAVLINFLGGESVAGGKMKEAGDLHWLPPNTGATNSSGFTGLPGGYRFDNEVFFDLNAFGMWWSSTDFYSIYGNYRQITYSDENIGGAALPKACGFSVRCVRNQ